MPSIPTSIIMTPKNTKKQKTKIAVVIVTFNNEKTVQKCLESVSALPSSEASAKKDSSPELTPELNIYLIDNASRDKTVSVAKGLLSSKLQVTNYELRENSTNVGFAAAVNQGIRLAQKENDPDYFLLLNPDAWLENGCLEKMLEHSLSSSRMRGSIGNGENNEQMDSRLHGDDNEENYFLVSPKILNEDRTPWFVGGKIKWLRMKTIHILPVTGFPTPTTDYLTGCCLLIPKQIVKKIGLLDEKFFLYYEDSDFSLRAKKAGFDLKIISDAICFHGESESFKPLPLPEGGTQEGWEQSKSYNLVKSGLLFFHKHYPTWAKPYFWLMFYLRLFYHKLFSKKQSVIQAFQDFRLEMSND